MTGRATEESGRRAERRAAPSGARAGFWLRFMSALIDGVPLTIITNLTADIGATWLGVVIGFIYFTAFEGSKRGQTLGKRIVKIQVADIAAGGSIGYGRAFVRHGGRFVSAIVLVLGYLWMLWDRERQTWHDKLSDSVVVPVRSK